MLPSVSCVTAALTSEVGAVLIAGAIAAVVAIWGVLSQRAISRRKATLEYIARGEADADIIAARRKFIELSKAPAGLAAWADEDKEQSAEVQSIRLVLNEYELIAIGIQRGIIDFELYKRWHRSGAIRYWQHAAPFVLQLRARLRNDAIYHEFEEMVRWFKGTPMPRRSWVWGKLF